MDKKLLTRAKDRLFVYRQEGDEKRLELINILMKDDEYRSIDEKKNKLVKIMLSDMERGKDISDYVRMIDNIEKYQAELATKLGVDLNVYRCKKCNDTGYIGEGDFCDCLKRLYQEEVRKQSGMTALPAFTFEQYAPLECKQSDKLSALYRVFEKYCADFPANHYKTVVLSGKVGVGKSYLVAAIANKLLERNFTVQYLSAFALNDIFVKYHTTPIAERSLIMDELIKADMLVIDDLGTEPVFQRVTAEYLYNLLELRQNKHTLITTNYDIRNNDFKQRYGERIMSRLNKKETSLYIYLDGDDLRFKVKADD